MIMTPEEQKEMLDLIKECQQISDQKTKAIEEIILAAQAVLAENAVLRNENERLKRHLSIAEGAILRLKAEK
jgi:regulator of replication initiation timing